MGALLVCELCLVGDDMIADDDSLGIVDLFDPVGDGGVYVLMAVVDVEGGGSEISEVDANFGIVVHCGSFVVELPMLGLSLDDL
jgi:hypothetical protein